MYLPADPRLDLDKTIRPTLNRLEDSIIFNLFERSRFKRNLKAYDPNEIKISGFNGSFFDFLLHGTECLHANAGRYEYYEEHPFSENLPKAIFPRNFHDSPIIKTNINFNDIIIKTYFDSLDDVCEPGDDTHYGSSVVCDIKALQDISNRIHYGANVAESKFQEDPEAYTSLVAKKDTPGIIKKLVNKDVENKVLARVEKKGEKYNVNPKFISKFYKEKIIPLTIQVEVEYFYKRAK